MRRERKKVRKRKNIPEGGSWRDAGATRANHSVVSSDRERRSRRIDNRFAFVWLTIKFSYESAAVDERRPMDAHSRHPPLSPVPPFPLQPPNAPIHTSHGLSIATERPG